MTDICMIGAGGMGRALAGALLNAGHTVSVWNRTPGKSATLVAAGASAADDFVDGVSGAELVIVCITDYAAATELMARPEHEKALRGRTVLQLSTGSALEAKEAGERMAQAGIPYLDGAIVAYPSDVGEPHCLILFGGSKELFDRHKDTLAALGGRTEWCGADLGIPSALDSSLLLFLTSGLLGYVQSAALADAEGVPLPVLLDATVGVMDMLIHALPDLTGRMDDGAYGEDQFTIEGYAFVARHIRERAATLGIQSELLDSFGATFAAAQSAGHGDDGLAALFATPFGKKPEG